MKALENHAQEQEQQKTRPISIFACDKKAKDARSNFALVDSIKSLYRESNEVLNEALKVPRANRKQELPSPAVEPIYVICEERRDGESRTQLDAFEAGIDYVISKEPSPQELIRIIERSLIYV